jgi:hypothetical protein
METGRLAIGAYREDTAAVDAGATYVFPVPEPSLALLQVAGLIGLAAVRTRAGRKA